MYDVKAKAKAALVGASLMTLLSINANAGMNEVEFIYDDEGHLVAEAYVEHFTLENVPAWARKLLPEERFTTTGFPGFLVGWVKDQATSEPISNGNIVNSAYSTNCQIQDGFYGCLSIVGNNLPFYFCYNSNRYNQTTRFASVYAGQVTILNVYVVCSSWSWDCDDVCIIE